MTLVQLIQKFDDLDIPHTWKIKMFTQTEYHALKGIHVIGQGEVGLVFEDHQRLSTLSEDPETWEIPVA